ncbi:universal stress protein [Varunaivibrio sulfuroxidans]|uniref:Nucleotide-binding universal stress UspA family protein n=1 Tax=Varunaivibrio sulfuroxidans TaxID=1773489 RepID=A0A4R3JG68_9PROT|nr:universal stress protein [Varunaivibrio sulfuroxidans]TCS64293.1 nucleotide-binding universal stress UspA family protein [Varunaivibrio sulfuroxidans]WES31271.1 universal stress protein [Varunaivibrio sulfuroxidans]
MNDLDQKAIGDAMDDHRFRILVCIDGSDESYRGLRYAAKLGGGIDADIVLLYVRPADQGLRSGGFEIEVARQNMLEWGLELPGIKYLKKGRDLLVDLGVMDNNWEQHSYHTDVQGTTLGDNKIEYRNENGKKTVLKLKVAPDVATGILQQYELAPYDLIILGASSRWKGSIKGFWDPAVAEKVAIHAPCSVLIARDLEVGHGHLICTDGSATAMDMVRKDAMIASRCQCPISIMSVALDDEGEEKARENVEAARNALESMKISVAETLIRRGDPVEEIVEAGPDYSLIVLSDTAKSGLHRFFMGSVAFKVMETAHNSVMIVR